MPQGTNFHRKIIYGFAASILAAIVIIAMSLYSIQSIIKEKDVVTSIHAEDLVQVESLHSLIRQLAASTRGYFLNPDDKTRQNIENTQKQILDRLSFMRGYHSQPVDISFLNEIEALEKTHRATTSQGLTLAEKASVQELAQFYKTELEPQFLALSDATQAYVIFERAQFTEAQSQSVASTRRTMALFIVIAIAALLLATILAVLFARTLGRIHRQTEETIDALKKSAEDRRQAEVERAQVMEARENLLTVVSHDLKNPLSAILTSADLLLRSPQIDPRIARQTVERIKSAAHRMARLISDLLDQARIEAGRLSIQPRKENLRNLVNGVLETLQPLALTKTISIEPAIDPENEDVFCDYERTLQVLSNLVGNAIKFGPVGGKIRIASKSLDHEVLVSIEDNGPGIPKHLTPHIFKPYWQGASTTADKGTGLGLAIAKGIVESHGGRIWVESVPGSGSTFYFTLPVSRAKMKLAG